jgi:hypothetical protein
MPSLAKTPIDASGHKCPTADNRRILNMTPCYQATKEIAIGQRQIIAT